MRDGLWELVDAALLLLLLLLVLLLLLLLLLLRDGFWELVDAASIGSEESFPASDLWLTASLSAVPEGCSRSVAVTAAVLTAAVWLFRRPCGRSPLLSSTAGTSS